MSTPPPRSPNVNAGFQLMCNKDYPQIADDFATNFAVLKSLPRDIFLGAHGGYYDMEAKFPRLKDATQNPFIDPQGYQRYIADREQAFQDELHKQQSSSK